MSGRSVIVVGLGPGSWDDLTLAARTTLERAERVVCRTTRHPTVDALRALRPELAIDAFDALYDGAQSFESLYQAMALELVERAEASGSAAGNAPIVYAVPGHPLIGEESVRRLRALGGQRGISVQIVPGLSFVEPVCAALGLDPLDRHLQLLDATLLADMDAAEVMGALQPTLPALVAQLYNRRLASGVKLALGEIYPDDWQVTIVRSAGMPGAEAIQRVPLFELDRAERADHLTTLYVPPLDRLQALRVPGGLRYVVQRLRAPDGCPWDREQTHQTLRTYVLEEAYEVAEVLDEWDDSPAAVEHLAEELGDLLLQVYLQAEVAHEEGHFHIGDVYEAITTKLIRRHPHVFGEATVRDAAHVVQNWETLKRQERAAQGDDVAAESQLRGIPKSAPALYQAQELSRKAGQVGFDWPEIEGVLAKVTEEAREVVEARASGEREQVRAELGDLLFAVAALARRLDVAPEDALQAANRRFRARFEHMEARGLAEGRDLRSLTLDEWLAWWDAAKRG